VISSSQLTLIKISRRNRWARGIDWAINSSRAEHFHEST